MNAAQAIQAHFPDLKDFEVAALVGVSKGAWSLYLRWKKKPLEETIQVWVDRLAEQGHELAISRRPTPLGCVASPVEVVTVLPDGDSQ